MVQIPRYINVEVTGCIGMTATCGCQPPAPSSCTNVYSRKQQEPNNFPPRCPKKGEPGSESMCGEGGREGVEGRCSGAASCAAWPPIFDLFRTDWREEGGGMSGWG